MIKVTGVVLEIDGHETTVSLKDADNIVNALTRIKGLERVVPDEKLSWGQGQGILPGQIAPSTYAQSGGTGGTIGSASKGTGLLGGVRDWIGIG